MRPEKINLYAQLIIWIAVCLMLCYLLFVVDSPHWVIPLIVGLMTQIIGIIHLSRTRKINITWFILVVIPFLLLSMLYLEGNDLISTRFFGEVSVFITSIMCLIACYLLTIVQIIKEIRLLKSSPDQI
ncbi:hypothetical protein BKI52_06535 [marine bacterium AO1-C]|nr:hypothetical protein BKI52_06535 [marine bacterium AO1-C]